MNSHILNFSLLFEKKIWMEYIIGKMIDLPTKCESCGNPNIHLNDYNSVCNP
jgi:hypothetical protein